MKSAGPDREGTFRAPLGSARRGRIVLVGGVSDLIIGADSTINDLYRARFQEPVPGVGMEGGTIIVRYPRLRPFEGSCRERAGEVVLGARIPWRIEFGGGVSRLTADLSGLELDAFEVEGGAGRVELRLPKPSGSVPVCFRGGASNVAVRRPEGVAARLQVSGGVTRLSFDGRHFGVVGDEVDLRTLDYDDASGRYDIAITGGANNLTVEGPNGPRPTAGSLCPEVRIRDDLARTSIGRLCQ
ncbi:MAG TPA: hypothetical protein VK869_08370 [Rubrobacteraceae bacterium]|nr:hypothetical protein [Rubrobacteraceae bacterium]